MKPKNEEFLVRVILDKGNVSAPLTLEELLRSRQEGSITDSMRVLVIGKSGWTTIGSLLETEALSTMPDSFASNTTLETKPDGSAAATPEGIGGWLILPAIQLILGGINLVGGLFMSPARGSDLPSQDQGVFALSLLFELGLTVFLIYAAVRFFGKRRNAPATMIGLMIAHIVVAGLLLAISIGVDAEPFADAYGMTLALSILRAIIWIPYFIVSERVKRTFVIP